MREEGYAMMNKLGKDMARELDLLTGMQVRTYAIYMHVCTFLLQVYVYLCVLCVMYPLHCIWSFYMYS